MNILFVNYGDFTTNSLNHIGGFELSTGCWMNSVWPEVAADYLRGVELED